MEIKLMEIKQGTTKEGKFRDDPGQCPGRKPNRKMAYIVGISG
jgi:hypothetical protein